ncbi:MFS transporter [Streptomyces sp. NPDC006335]|uniref:MFS transporter n=1 Tax=Streptomyces sp. NPDC006335 TaxID=3156895 RepID=UPI0033A21E1C
MAPVGGRVTSRFGPRLPAAAGLLVAACGLALLARAGTHADYADLLPTLLLWGIGCGLLAPAVVAAAIATVPAERSGLASAVDNTARQTGGAIGIVVAGAVAGEPGDQTRARLGLPLRGRRGAGADPAAGHARTGPPALMRSGPLREQGSGPDATSVRFHGPPSRSEAG